MKRTAINSSDDFTDKETTVMIFTEGTVLGPRRLIDHFNHAGYVPIKNCIVKIKNWEHDGARIVYLTSGRRESSVQSIRALLIKYGFPGTYLYYRSRGERYKDIVETIKPDILVEDNCKSIGGRWQMSITYVDKKIKAKIKSVVVNEFQGIDLLPDSLSELLAFKKGDAPGPLPRSVTNDPV